MDFLIVAIFGGFLGCAEILSRYRDAPFKAIFNWYAGIYVLVNAIAAICALLLIHLFDLTFGQESDVEKLRWVQIMIAGFGAMLFFRSSFFIFKIGDQNVGLGPSTILQIMLDVLDSEVDRARAKQRGKIVEDVMMNVNFQAASKPLPLVAFSLMQNLPTSIQHDVADEVVILENDKDMSDSAKSIALGCILMNNVGEDVLKESVKLLWKDICKEPDSLPGEEIEKTPSKERKLEEILEASLSEAERRGMIRGVEGVSNSQAEGSEDQ
jgi:hypothetical protein